MASFIALSWHSWQQPSAVTDGFGQRLSGCLCSTVVHLYCQSMVAPCEVRILHPLAPQKRPTFVPRMTPAVGEVRRERMRHCGPVAEHQHVCRNPSRSDQFYVPEFAELTRVVLVVRKGCFAHSPRNNPSVGEFCRHPCTSSRNNLSLPEREGWRSLRSALAS